MQLTFASYNIHKAVGVDGRRDPDRILAILREIDADVVALQEADRRFRDRPSVLPRQAIDDHSTYRVVPLVRQVGSKGSAESIGWHGNALLVRRNIAVTAARVVPLPTIEPRGAISVDLELGANQVRVLGMHLDLSGLRRRQQVRAVLAHLGACGPRCPTVLMGDLNEWALHGGCLREFSGDWRVLAPGRSFPSRRPVAQLDRIVISPDWNICDVGVHHSALAARGSDHLPVYAKLDLPNN